MVGEIGVGTSRQCMPHHLKIKKFVKNFHFLQIFVIHCMMYDDDLLITLYLYLVRVLCSVCLNLYLCYVLRTRTCATRTCAHLLGLPGTWTTWTTCDYLDYLRLLATTWTTLHFPIEQRHKSNTRFGQLHFDDPTVAAATVSICH